MSTQTSCQSDGTSVPIGMREVSETEFFGLLKADPRDIMPSLASPDFSSWETTNRQVWGWSAPGRRGGMATRFAVVRS